MVECCCTCFILSYCFIRIYLNYYKKQSFKCLSFPPRSLASLSAPNPCAQADGRSPCSHLCLINFNQTFSCACPHLMKLQPDKRTCKGEEAHKQAQAELKPCVNCHDIRVVVQQQTASVSVLESLLMALRGRLSPQTASSAVISHDSKSDCTSSLSTKHPSLFLFSF